MSVARSCQNTAVTASFAAGDGNLKSEPQCSCAVQQADQAVLACDAATHHARSRAGTKKYARRCSFIAHCGQAARAAVRALPSRTAPITRTRPCHSWMRFDGQRHDAAYGLEVPPSSCRRAAVAVSAALIGRTCQAACAACPTARSLARCNLKPALRTDVDDTPLLQNHRIALTDLIMSGTRVAI